MSSLTPSEYRQLQSLFHLVDRDHSGSISRHEFSQLLRSLRLSASHAEIDLLIQACDINDDGEIDWSEFLQVMNQQQAHGATREELRDALRAFEGPRDSPAGQRPRVGVLSVAMVERAMELFHRDAPDAALGDRRKALRQMLQHTRVDGGGGFHYAHVRAHRTLRAASGGVRSPS